jgi:hypothetical protein
LRPQFDLKSEQEVQTLAFRTVFPVAFADTACELVRALPPVDFESFK